MKKLSSKEFFFTASWIFGILSIIMPFVWLIVADTTIQKVANENTMSVNSNWQKMSDNYNYLFESNAIITEGYTSHVNTIKVANHIGVAFTESLKIAKFLDTQKPYCDLIQQAIDIKEGRITAPANPVSASSYIRIYNWQNSWRREIKEIDSHTITVADPNSEPTIINDPVFLDSVKSDLSRNYGQLQIPLEAFGQLIFVIPDAPILKPVPSLVYISIWIWELPILLFAISFGSYKGAKYKPNI